MIVFFLTGPKKELIPTAGNCIWPRLQRGRRCYLQTWWMEPSLQAWWLKINISLCKMCFIVVHVNVKQWKNSAWQTHAVSHFQWLAGGGVLCFVSPFFGCSAFESNFLYLMRETEITISFPTKVRNFFLPTALILGTQKAILSRIQ